MTNLLSPAALERLRGVPFLLPRLFERGMAGRHQTTQQGSSVEFSQHRDYTIGDPIRHIDWKAFARSERFVIKEFESESNLQVLLVLDTSKSMAFDGGAPISKQSFACQIAHAFSWILLNQGDAVGLVSFSDGLPSLIPPSAIGAQFTHIEKALSVTTSASNTCFEDLSNFIHSRFSRNTVCIVITDFLDEQESNAQHFVSLKRRKYPTYCLHVLSPNELRLSEIDPTIYRDEERDLSLLSEPDAIKVAYDDIISDWLSSVAAECRHHGVPYQLALSDQDPVDIVRQLLGSTR